MKKKTFRRGENHADFLEIDHISKDVSGVKRSAMFILIFTLGEVHSLVGENGAGKIYPD